MQNILVPLNFTEVAFNALNYAIAVFPNSMFTILYVAPPSLNTVEVQYSILNRIRTDHDLMLKDLNDLIKLELGVKEAPDNVKTIVARGDVLPQVKEVLKSENIDLIMMGTRDKYDLLDRIIGTTSLSIIKQVDKPVYLIPRKSKYISFDRVLIACDLELEHEGIGKLMKEWNKPYNAYLRFLHIQNSANDFEAETEKLFKDIFKGDNPSFTFDITQISGKDIANKLIEEANKFKANLIVVEPSKQSFLSALFFKSISKDLILKSQTPMLFLKKM